MPWNASTRRHATSRAPATGDGSTSFGGGFLTSMLKHGKMETAQRHLFAAQAALGRLADELHDVEGFAGLGPDVGDFLLAADWLFDNAFMDAMVQQRIIESQNRVEQAIAQCEQVRDQLPRSQVPQPRCEQRPTGCGVGELCLAWCSGSFPVASPATRIAIVQ